MSPKKPEMKKVFLTILNHSHSHIFDNMSKNVQKNLFFCILILKKKLWFIIFKLHVAHVYVSLIKPISTHNIVPSTHQSIVNFKWWTTGTEQSVSPITVQKQFW